MKISIIIVNSLVKIMGKFKENKYRTEEELKFTRDRIEDISKTESINHPNIYKKIE